MTRLKFCPLSHAPFHLVGTGPRSSSSKLLLSGHIRVSIVPTMISLPYVVYCDHNLEEERPRESGMCVMEILLREDGMTAKHPSITSMARVSAWLSRVAKPCKRVSYVYNISDLTARPGQALKLVVRSEMAWLHGLEGVNKVSLSSIIILSSSQNRGERKRYECEKGKRGLRHGGKNIREYLVYGSMITRGSFIRAGRGS
ncbi:hypothetical protein SUGI_0573330 [Cryptomeria japonica]|nr:hypothetical protein SUGI_0573330 [Cryptomeria japonica]